MRRCSLRPRAFRLCAQSARRPSAQLFVAMSKPKPAGNDHLRIGSVDIPIERRSLPVTRQRLSHCIRQASISQLCQPSMPEGGKGNMARYASGVSNRPSTRRKQSTVVWFENSGPLLISLKYLVNAHQRCASRNVCEQCLQLRVKRSLLVPQRLPDGIVVLREADEN
mgnify:CR=1 FL=1